MRSPCLLSFFVCGLSLRLGGEGADVLAAKRHLIGALSGAFEKGPSACVENLLARHSCAGTGLVPIADVLLERANEAVFRAVGPNVTASGHDVFAGPLAAQVDHPGLLPHPQPRLKRELPLDTALLRLASLLLVSLLD